MPTPKQKLIHNPIPTFFPDLCLLLDEDIAGKIDSFLTKSMFTQTNKQRCRDGAMNEFLFWCRHPLVPLLFHEVTRLHPPSFQGNNFSTCISAVIINIAQTWHVFNKHPHGSYKSFVFFDTMGH